MTQRVEKTGVVGPENPRVTPDEALGTLMDRAARLREETGRRPVVVYDLDATLFDNRPRVLQILADTLALPETAELPAEVIETVRGIERDRLQYRLADTFRDYGLTDTPVIDFFQSRWFERFFTNEYVAYDEPTEGAVEFVRAMHETDVHTVYLTGRDTPGMRTGTHAALVAAAFPEPDGETCHLITKPTFEQADPEFKREAIEQIRELGPVAGVFDNEPKPLNVVAEAFPNAAIFFLDTMHSPDVEQVRPGVRVMRDFKLDGRAV